MSTDNNGKWYDEHLTLSKNECICDKKIELLLNKISHIFEQKITKLEGEILDLKSKIIEREVREQNMLIRKHVPVSFIPSHTNGFSEVRANIMSKKNPSG